MSQVETLAASSAKVERATLLTRFPAGREAN